MTGLGKPYEDRRLPHHPPPPKTRQCQPALVPQRPEPSRELNRVAPRVCHWSSGTHAHLMPETAGLGLGVRTPRGQMFSAQFCPQGSYRGPEGGAAGEQRGAQSPGPLAQDLRPREGCTQ